MFVINLDYTCPLEEVDKHVQAHRDFLDTYYQNGVLLASGPKVPRIHGGMLIAFGSDRAIIEKMIQEDPFYKEGIALYTITEFSAIKHRPEIQPLL